MNIAIWPEIKTIDDSPGYQHSKDIQIKGALTHRTVPDLYDLESTMDADHWIYPVFVAYCSKIGDYSSDDYIPIPDHIVERVHLGDITIVFDHSTENLDSIGMVTDAASIEFGKRINLYDYTYEIMCNTIRKYNFPKDRCIYIHGCVEADYTDQELFHSCHVSYYEHFFLHDDRSIAAMYKHINAIVQNKFRPYKTICLMNRVRESRIWFAYKYYKNNYLENNYVTLGKPHDYTNFTGQDDSKFIETLPWRMGNDMHNRTWHSTMLEGEYDRKHNDSYVSIVHESFDDTIPWKLGNHYTFVTEKTFYNIAMQRAFIVQGYPGSLKYLHSLGYKTFDKWWDESYDDQTGFQRLESIWNVVETINKKSQHELSAMLWHMIPVLQHNYMNYIQRQKSRTHFRNLDNLLGYLL